MPKLDLGSIIGSAAAPAVHAAQHSSGGSDPITPAMIGAAAVNASGTVPSSNADYAEVGEWSDGNPVSEDRLGYFVAVDNTEAGKTMVKATSEMDVHGVTVAAPAFSGNCSKDKFDGNGNLLKQYDYVAVMGFASVIDNGTCTINGRCMPDDNGTAVPSSNNMGYQVIDRIDSTHVLIAVEPAADMIQRIKHDVDNFDCGMFEDVSAALKAHSSDSEAHLTMSVDGNIDTASSSATTLEEHMVDENAHQNITIDGNQT